MKEVFCGEEMTYHVGGKTAVALTQCDPQFKDEVFEQRRIGLHHICFRALSREDIHKLYDYLKEIGARIITEPKEGPWGPGYYYILFEDPDGIRLEVNHVPGKGLFQEGNKFNTAGDYK